MLDNIQRIIAASILTAAIVVFTLFHDITGSQALTVVASVWSLVLGGSLGLSTPTALAAPDSVGVTPVTQSQTPTKTPGATPPVVVPDIVQVAPVTTSSTTV